MAAQDNEEPMEVEDDDQVKPPENGVNFKLLVPQSVENQIIYYCFIIKNPTFDINVSVGDVYASSVILHL
jgi:hypothetical protein